MSPIGRFRAKPQNRLPAILGRWTGAARSVRGASEVTSSRRPRRGSGSSRRGAGRLGSLVVVSVLVLIGLSLLLYRLGHRSAGVADLSVYCAAGLRYPMEEIVQQYKERYGVTVTVQYGGSNTLLSQIEVGKEGDLYLAGDESYIQLAQQKDLAAEVLPLATMRPVIVVPKQSSRQVASIDDLLQPDMRIACANPDAAAVGRLIRERLERTGQWEGLARQISAQGVFKPTVNDVANDVKLGAVDAGIVWDSTAAQYDQLQAIPVPELEDALASVEICVLQSSRNPTAALHFARYAAARDRGLRAFAEHGFQVVEGDIWQEVPELTFFAGSVNRRALEPILNQFMAREGVRVNTIYNGCGILTGQMRILAQNLDEGFPDTYMACDRYYLETVKELFQEDVDVSDTDIVIAVAKGNPKQIESLQDLLRPGVRVAVGQPEQCTIGVLTRRLLEHEGVLDQLMRDHVVTQTETSALLVPSVVTLSADAALAYRTDTLAESDKVDVIALDSPLAKAVQPFSIARSSQQKHLSRRLYQAITRSQSAFESAGFHWRLSDEAAGATEPDDAHAANAENPPSVP